MNPIIKIIFIGLITIHCFSSCAIKHEALLSFQEGENFDSIQAVLPPTLTVQVDDILIISIHSQSISAVKPFNLGSGVESDIITPGEYKVNNKGNINYPVLGNIKVEDLTIEEIQEEIGKKLTSYLKDYIVRVQLKNIRFTVIGEVNKPSTFVSENEKVTVLEAIGLAGDISPYGNREKILLRRERNGVQSFHFLNIQDRSLFSSPYFYIQQNDIIYVEPLEQKRAVVRSQSQNILPWVSAVTALTTLIITVLR